MILTQCAVCAAPLGLSLGKKCGRCSTRYCGAECQVQHWKEGGHDNLCKKIKKAGGAEQYNANKKYVEAVAVAAEACADDTKGQTCFICTQALHWKTKEGLVRGCSCRGTAGFAHVSCLAEQAKILVAEAEENRLRDKAGEAWMRWNTCSLCEQSYHGVVACALGWACWKTYVGRWEMDWARVSAMRTLGNGLRSVDHHEDVLPVQEAEVAMLRRIGAGEDSFLTTQSNLASTYQSLGRLEEALQMRRSVYSGRLKLNGEEHEETIRVANNYVATLMALKHFKEAKLLLRKTMPGVQRVLGKDHTTTFTMRMNYAAVRYADPASTLDDLREAVTTGEETAQTARRVLGGAHPITSSVEASLRIAREVLRAREAPEVLQTADDLAAHFDSL